MFNNKKNNNNSANTPAKPSRQRDSIPTIVTSDVHLLGNMVSEGAVDFSGTIDGNIRCDMLTLRQNGIVKGEIDANTVHIHGTVKGLIRAKNVHLLASCKVEGIIIHEQLSIEDGAFVDGKFKRSDRIIKASDEEDQEDAASSYETMDTGSFSGSGNKMLENIRLIR